MFTQVLTIMLTISIVTITIAYLYKIVKNKPHIDTQGNVVLHLPKFYYRFGFLILIIGVILLGYGIFLATEEDRGVSLLFSAVNSITGAYLFGKGYIGSVTITPLSIIQVNCIGTVKEINISDISSATFGHISKEIKIVANNNKTIKVHERNNGFGTLIEKLEEITGKTSVEMGVIKKRLL